MSDSRWTTVHGHSSSGVPKALAINANDQLQVEIVSGQSTYVQIDPQLVPVAEADLYDPGADAGDMFDVEFLVVNVDGTSSVDVTVGQDVAGGGSLSAAEYFMFEEPVPPNTNSGWRGPFRIGGDDHIRGVASAASDATIHFRVKKVVDV